MKDLVEVCKNFKKRGSIPEGTHKPNVKYTGKAMPSFENLKSMEVSPEATVKYEITDITLAGRVPILDVKMATMYNKDYMNVRIKTSSKDAQKIRRGVITTRLLSESRDGDRKLYPKFIIMDWENVVDSNGVLVEFSESNCLEFIAALPDWIFDGLRAFCSEISNFVDQPDDEYFIKNS